MICLLVLTGCIFITADEADARYDRDEDGVDVFTDCDDHDPAVALPGEWYPDGDGDGFGAGAPTTACEAPPGYAPDGDCDDDEASIHPDAAEVCDGTDNNCNGYVDEESQGTASTWYVDGDGDGYGDEASAIEACEPPDDHIERGGDCDDASADVHPEATEVCDTIDNDCDGLVDDDDDPADPIEWAPDLDGDGYGDADAGITIACFPPEDHAAPGDCDDTNDAINPTHEEVCGDGLDNDCDGATCRLAGEWELEAMADSTLYGETYYGLLGAGMAAGSDLTGDGDPDLLLGAVGTFPSGGAYYADGEAWLVPGPANGVAGVADVGRVLVAPGNGGNLGGVLAMGDLTGDGAADAIVAAPKASFGVTSDAGLIFIAEGPVGGDVSLAEDGLKLTNTGGSEFAGWSLYAGDLNGDGQADLAVGAPWMEYNAETAGGVYWLEGPFTGDLQLSAADTTLVGPTGSFAGYSASGGGDLTGDGYPDLLIGGYNDDDGRGAAWVIEGPPSGSSLDWAGNKLSGLAGDGFAGYAVAIVGDVDGDGNDDALVGAPNESVNGSSSGAAYLFYGPISADLNMEQADVLFDGASSSDRAGNSVAAPGDVDGDGRADLLISALYGGADSRGEIYLHYDAPDAPVHDVHTGELLLSARDSIWTEWDREVVPAGDMDGDGYGDFLVGSPNETWGNYGEGAVYLFYGGRDL